VLRACSDISRGRIKLPLRTRHTMTLRTIDMPPRRRQCPQHPQNQFVAPPWQAFQFAHTRLPWLAPGHIGLGPRRHVRFVFRYDAMTQLVKEGRAQRTSDVDVIRAAPSGASAIAESPQRALTDPDAHCSRVSRRAVGGPQVGATTRMVNKDFLA
jgi:hypothetical protein